MSWCKHCGWDIEWVVNAWLAHDTIAWGQDEGHCDSSHDGYHHPATEVSIHTCNSTDPTPVAECPGCAYEAANLPPTS